MKKLITSYIGILSSLCLIYTGICHAWVIGENRLINSDFENDIVGKEPKEWALEKGG